MGSADTHTCDLEIESIVCARATEQFRCYACEGHVAVTPWESVLPSQDVPHLAHEARSIEPALRLDDARRPRGMECT